MNDLISVIVPVYNVEKYLKRCVDSIIWQSYSNLEIILVNDGSPDRCGEICNEYAKKDDRVRVIHKKNGGLSDARNAGVEIARGNYLAFIDSDDWVNEKYFEKLYQLISNTNSDIVSCNFLETDGKVKTTIPQEVEIYTFTNYEALEQLTNKFYSQLVVSWGKIYKSNLFNDIKFPVGKIHEDEFVIHHLLYSADKVVLTTEQLYYYYQRNDSITGEGFNIKGRVHASQALEDRAKLFNQIGLIKSRDSVYQTLFNIYRQIIEYEQTDKDKNYNKSKIFERYSNLRYKLRNGDYGFKHKLFYESYYIMPSIIKKVYNLHRKLNKY